RGAVAMVTIAANGKGQRLGDIAAGTTVVKLVPQHATSSDAVFTQVESDYQPSFLEVQQLSDNDIEMIQQALAVNLEQGNIRPVTLLTEKVKSLLGIESDLPPVKFLYTIVKDYSYVTSHK